MNETHFYYFCKSVENGKFVMQLFQSDENIKEVGKMKLIAYSAIMDENDEKEVQLRINAEGKDYSFQYSFDNINWVTLKDKVDGTFIRAVIPRDFVGAVIGMYATSNGEPTNNKSYYNWFEYIGNDKIYNIN